MTAILNRLNQLIICKTLKIDNPYFLYVGTIEPRKNLITLLKAFSKFKKSLNSDIKLIIVGQPGWKTGAFYNHLEQNQYKRDIILTGFVDEEALPQLYSHATAFIYPSEYEGFGLPILEAMACGAPVIAARNSSLTEVGGDAVHYFETKDAHDLCKSMEKVYLHGHDVKEKQKLGMLRASTFSWQEYANRLLEALKKKVN